MKLFNPERVFFDPKALQYPLGQALYQYFKSQNVDVLQTGAQQVMKQIPGADESQKYARSKKSLFITVKKSSKLDVCKPSADYEFSLMTNCPGNCEYCYLQTTQGYKPYLKIYVNLEDIFRTIHEHLLKTPDEIVTFEAASAGDPLALEHITGSLAKTIEFFGTLERARLRVVTKFSHVDSLLHLSHQGHTRFRFSINTEYVLHHFEHNTSTLGERIEAAVKLAGAGYPIGFIVAPIMVYRNWKEEYTRLFDELKARIGQDAFSDPLTFELIQHRFTPVAKSFIIKRFPKTKLDLDETKRTLKWGKYGRFKYVYPKELSSELKHTLSDIIKDRFPTAKIEYFT